VDESGDRKQQINLCIYAIFVGEKKRIRPRTSNKSQNEGIAKEEIILVLKIILAD